MNVFHHAKWGNEHHDNNKIRERNERVRRHEKQQENLSKWKKTWRKLVRPSPRLPSASGRDGGWTKDQDCATATWPPLPFGLFFLFFSFVLSSFLFFLETTKWKKGWYTVSFLLPFSLYSNRKRGRTDGWMDGWMDYERVDEERRLAIDISLITLWSQRQWPRWERSAPLNATTWRWTIKTNTNGKKSLDRDHLYSTSSSIPIVLLLLTLFILAAAASSSSSSWQGLRTIKSDRREEKTPQAWPQITVHGSI